MNNFILIFLENISEEAFIPTIDPFNLFEYNNFKFEQIEEDTK